METNRSKLREKIMTIIYQISLYKSSGLEYDIDNVIKENVEVDNEFVKEMVYGIITYFDDLGQVANNYLNKWSIDRLDNTGAA
ncbi:MAG: transcription antitermination factor NusB, partial [Bacilli bacterium]